MDPHVAAKSFLAKNVTVQSLALASHLAAFLINEADALLQKGWLQRRGSTSA